jgi:hypothetical protein
MVLELGWDWVSVSGLASVHLQSMAPNQTIGLARSAAASHRRFGFRLEALSNYDLRMSARQPWQSQFQFAMGRRKCLRGLDSGQELVLVVELVLAVELASGSD